MCKSKGVIMKDQKIEEATESEDVVLAAMSGMLKPKIQSQDALNKMFDALIRTSKGDEVYKIINEHVELNDEEKTKLKDMISKISNWK